MIKYKQGLLPFNLKKINIESRVNVVVQHASLTSKPKFFEYV